MQIDHLSIDFSDNRGSIMDILYDTKIDHVAIIETNSGSFIRGNHYHKQTTQRIYMLDGCLRYWYNSTLDFDPKNTKSVLVEPGALVTTPPNEIHSLEMLGSSRFLVLSSGIRGGKDYESDTFRDFVILTPEMLSA